MFLALYKLRYISRISVNHNDMTMKKSNKNKTGKKSDHKVETPVPPQVMDPSAPPLKKEKDVQKSKEADARTVEKKKAPDEGKLAPSEEL
jgi:hypothetical protein